MIYANLVTVAELQRNPTVKQEIADKENIFKKGNVTYGFLGYPVSQAADITFCRADLVPVGEDQKPMIELTRSIANRFNKNYGEIFPLPETIISEVPRLMGLDGRKMSKSFNNAIYLSDTKEAITKKVMSAKTDTENSVVYNPNTRPEISNLIRYYQIASGETIKNIENKFANLTSYKLFKEELIKVLDNFLTPIRNKRAEYAKQPKLLTEILEQGRKKAQAEAAKTMKLVREAMKIDY